MISDRGKHFSEASFLYFLFILFQHCTSQCVPALLLKRHEISDGGWLTPSLPQPVKFPGWKMHGRACKQYIFRFYNTPTFNARRFDENLFTCHCEKENKKAYGFQISHFYWSFLKRYHGSEEVKGPRKAVFVCNGTLKIDPIMKV